MKAPDKIYIFQDGDISWYKPEEWEIPSTDRVEYIRADLAELTWEDVRELCALSFAVEVDLGREISDARHYGEVLRRFLESKGIKNEE